jgi:hypothetical protein
MVDILPIQPTPKYKENVSIRSSNRSFLGFEKRNVYSRNLHPWTDPFIPTFNCMDRILPPHEI